MSSDSDKCLQEGVTANHKINELLSDLVQNLSITQMVLYSDDSSEFTYPDGTSVQLSSCGANYRYLETSDDGRSGAQQMTRYVTSERKVKVEAALMMRNVFASRAYVITSDQEVVHHGVGGLWTGDHTTSGALYTSPEGNVEFYRNDRLMLTRVDYLSEASYDEGSRCNIRVPRTSVFPTHHPPPPWKPTSSVNEKREIPRPYNKTCDQQFRHDWAKRSKVEVFYAEGCFYWILPRCRVHVWLGAGAGVLVSHPQNKFYYQHVPATTSSVMTSSEQEYRTYSVTSRFTDERIKSVVMRANRLSMCCGESPEADVTSSCFVDDDVKDDDVCVSGEVCEVEGLGRFTFARNHVHISFVDGTSLYSDVTHPRHHHTTTSPLAVRIFMSDGSYVSCDDVIAYASPRIQPYVTSCQEWIRWLGEIPRTKPFQHGTIFSPRVGEWISSELDKIRSFTSSTSLDDDCDVRQASDVTSDEECYDVDAMLMRNAEMLADINLLQQKR